jgi:murein L,D-transpeptidase YcbB/YkuD
MSKENEFIESLDGELSHEQVAQLLWLGEEGDTDTELSEEGGAPGAATADGQAEQGKPDAAQDSAPNEEALDAENTVILARDRKHTIDYGVLLKSREGEKHWKGQAAELQTKYETAMQELEALRAQPQKTAAAAIAPAEAAAIDAALEAGLDPDELLGDFSAEAIVKGMARVADQRVASAMAQMDSKLKQALEPFQQSQQLSAQEAHAKAIYDAHPDLDSLVESQELKSWIEQQVAAQPSFQQAAVRAGFEQVLERGTTAQVIELFNSFKGESGRTQPATTDVKAAARAVAARSQAQPPVSLSDIPGGRVGAASSEEAMAGMSGAELIAAMDDWPQEKIDRYMNSL